MCNHAQEVEAIAATLGNEQPPVDKLIRCLENDYGITASWDGLCKVWLTERATLGRGTCKMIPSFTSPATLNDCQEFRCSACGEYMVMQQFPGCADDAPSYCPSCGRKVVE